MIAEDLRAVNSPDRMWGIFEGRDLQAELVSKALLDALSQAVCRF